MIFHFLVLLLCEASLYVKKGIDWMLVSILFCLLALISASRDCCGFLISFGVLIT